MLQGLCNLLSHFVPCCKVYVICCPILSHAARSMWFVVPFCPMLQGLCDLLSHFVPCCKVYVICCPILSHVAIQCFHTGCLPRPVRRLTFQFYSKVELQVWHRQSLLKSGNITWWQGQQYIGHLSALKEKIESFWPKKLSHWRN